MSTSDWKEVKVKDVATIVSGATPKSAVKEYWNGNIPWLTPKDLSINPSMYTSRGERSITKEGYNSSSTKLVPKGSVLLTSRAPVGYVTIANNEICTNQGFKNLVFKNENNVPEFWYYLLSFHTPLLQRVSGGSTFKELSKTTLESLSFIIPPLPVQQLIVTVMQSIDEHIANMDAYVSSLEALRTNTLNSLLSGEESEGWEEVQIGQIGTIMTGNTPPTKDVKNWDSLDIPFVTAIDMDYKGSFVSKNMTTRFASNYAWEKSNKKFENFCVAQVCIASIGKTSYFKSPALFNQQINAVVGLSESDAIVLSAILSNSSFINKMNNLAGKTAVPILSKSKWEKMKIKWPDVSLRNELANKIKEISLCIEKSKKELDALNAMRTNVLNALLSGEHEIPESLDNMITMTVQ
mgnify:CR=1 FL=1